MPSWVVECGARLILATRIIDKAHVAFDRMRSALVLALASDAVLDRFNDLAYGRDPSYQPDSLASRGGLFSWEDRIVETYFPRPPARLLIGGAGGGREALALAERGYEVVAFEPSAPLVTAMACRLASRSNARVYRARYEDMPQLSSARPGEPGTTLESEPTFDAAILGWASFSHLRNETQRVQTLSSFARYVHGPILVSFCQSSSDEAPDEKAHTGWFQRIFNSWFSNHREDWFSVYIGFSHNFSAVEIETMASRSGLKVVYINQERRKNSPHAVLVSVNLAQPSV